MKKLFALFCALLFILSLCSCGKGSGDDGETTRAEETRVHHKAVKYSIKSEKYSEDFKDEEGETIARLELTYPVITCKERPDSADYINQWFEEFKTDEIDSVRINLDSVSERNRKFGIEGVYITRINTEVYYEGPYHVSFTMKRQTGVNPDEEEGTLTGCNFSLADGSFLSLKNLYKSGEGNPREEIKRMIQEEADISYSVRGNIALSEQQKAILDDLFDEDNFCLNKDTFDFPYSFATLSSGARSGFYICPVTFIDARDILMNPAEYFELNYED